MDLPHGRARRRLRSRRQARVRGDARPGARLAVSQHADQHRDRARSRDRPAALALRPADRARPPLFGSDVARRLLVDRRGRRPDRALRPSHHHGHARCPAHRARWPHRPAVPRFRQRRQGESERRRARRLDRQLPRDFAAGDLSQHRHRRLRDRRQRRRRNAARHRARVRRAQRQAAVGLGSDSHNQRRSSASWLATQVGAAHGRGERLVGAVGRRRPRPGIRAHRLGEPGLLRRRAHRRQPVCELAGRAARRNR